MDIEKVRSLTSDEYESLVALYRSNNWKVYSMVLNQRIVAKTFTALPLKSGDEALKALGEIAGMNEAINLIRVLAEEHEGRIKKAQGRT